MNFVLKRSISKFVNNNFSILIIVYHYRIDVK